jgi:hypothetical protein
MINWFKKHFIPHAGNDHHPHFLRIENIRLMIVIIFVIELGVFSLPFLPAINFAGNSYLASVLPSVLDELTNQNRQAQNLNILTVNPVLNRVAELKAKDMAEKSYFAHTSPEGKSPWYWFNQAGYKYEFAGENLAVDFTDSKDVTLAWMNSPTHKANIVKSTYTEMGTGVATGTLDGKQTIFVAQVFGRPARNNVAIAKQISLTNVGETSKTDSVNVKGVSSESDVIEESTPTTTVPVLSSVESDLTPDQALAKANILEKAITSPRHLTNLFYLVLGILVVFAIGLKLSIGPIKKHPFLITNGLAVLVILFGAYTVNDYVARSKMKTIVSFVSFQGEQFEQDR